MTPDDDILNEAARKIRWKSIVVIMLEIVVVILLLLWALGGFAPPVAGRFLHLSLIIAITVYVIRLIRRA